MLAPATTGSLRDELAKLVAGGRASNDDADRVAYARDLWPRQQIATRSGNVAPAPPGVIVWPSSTDEVVAIVAYAKRRGIPLVPFGAGSGVCGGVQATPETIVLDLKRMRRVLDVRRDVLEVEAEAGILGQHLEDDLASRGFTLGHFPSSIYCSTLGGWIAARSAGQCSGRYGKIEDMILGIECVDGNGEVLTGDSRDERSALVDWVTGSEGILAIVTKASLRIAPAPAERRFASYVFGDVASGLSAIRRVYQAGLRPAVARLYDPFDTLLARRGGLRAAAAGEPLHLTHELELEPEPEPDETEGGYRPGLAGRLLTRALRRPFALNKLIDLLPDRALGGALLVLVWEANAEIGDAERDAAAAICLDAGGRDTGEAPGKRWLSHRHSVSYRQSPMFASGAFVDTMEVAATWSRLLPMYEAVRAALSPHVFVMAHFSHAYPDGASIYFTFAGAGRDDRDTLTKYDAAWRDALDAVVRAGGTFSHHHGVGRSKAPAMRAEQGVAVDLVHAAKRAFDPSAILNPGSLIGSVRTSEPKRGGASGVGADESPDDALLATLERDFHGVLQRGSERAVILPRSEAELADIVRLAGTLGARIAPPGQGGEDAQVSVDLRRLGSWLGYDDASRIAHVEAGMTLARVEEELARRHQTLGVAEGFGEIDIATWIAEGTAGAPSKNDDPVAQLFAGLSAVLPSGDVLHVRPAPRRAVGPDVAGAFVGTRGRFGILTSVHLVTRPRTESTELAFSFDDVESARAAIAWIRGCGVRPHSVAITRTGPTTWLTVSIDGDAALHRARLAIARGLAKERGGSEEDPQSAPPRRPRAAVVSPPEIVERVARAVDPAGTLR